MKRALFFFLAIWLLPGPAFSQGNHEPDNSLRQSKLFSVIRSGETARLEQLLNEGASANDSVDHYSLLMLAAMSGSLDEMKILVEHGADVNYMNSDSLTAIWLAIPDYDKTVYLMKQGANIQAKTVGGRTPIMKLALMPGSADLIREFIGKGVNPADNNMQNILIENAGLSADTSNLSIFLQAGLDINAPDRSGSAPIVYVSTYTCYPTVKMMVEHGADFNAVDKKFKYTPLMNAALCGDDSSMVYLLQKAADAKIVDSFIQFTALTWLALSDLDRPDIVDALCHAMGDVVYQKGKDGHDALYWMKTKGNNKSVQVLSAYENSKK